MSELPRSGERSHGQQLADQALDASLVLGGELREPVGDSDPAVEFGVISVGQLERPQSGGVQQGQTRERVSVDTVGLGMSGEEAAEVGSLGRRDPIDDVATALEEDRNRQPGWPCGLDDDLKFGARSGARKGGTLDLLQALDGRLAAAAADLGPVAGEDADGVAGSDAQVDTDQATVLTHMHLLWGRVCGDQLPHGGRAPRPRSQSGRAWQRLPFICCRRARSRRTVPLSLCGSSVARPGVAIRCTRRSVKAPPSEPEFVATPRTSRDIHPRASPVDCPQPGWLFPPPGPPTRDYYCYLSTDSGVRGSSLYEP